MDTIATTTNTNQADDQSAKPGRLSGQQHDDTDADGTADRGPAADQPGRPHHLGRRVGACR